MRNSMSHSRFQEYIKKNMLKNIHMPSKKCTNLTTTLFVKKLEICSLNNSEMFKLRKNKTHSNDLQIILSRLVCLRVLIEVQIDDPNWRPKLTIRIENNYVLLLLPETSLAFLPSSHRSSFLDGRTSKSRYYPLTTKFLHE